MKNLKRVLSLIVAVFMLASILVGCEGTNQVSTTTTIPKVIDFSTAQDSSELPNWTGKQLKLSSWNAFGTIVAEGTKSEGNVVVPEVTRITGISNDDEKSYDNGGEGMDVKLGKVIASKNWTDLIINPDRNVFVKMVNSGIIWDLTGLIEENCPNLLKALPKDKVGGLWDNTWVNGGQPGKIYGLPTAIQAKWQNLIDPDLDLAKWSGLASAQPQDPSPYVLVRDDILKMIFPNARTEKEIDDLYVQKNGKLSKEDILDVTFNTKDEFVKFLYDIKKLGIKEGNKEVFPIFTAPGSIDNWALLTYMGGLFGWNPGMPSADNNYFSYWNKTAQKVDYMFRQDFFKDAMKTINLLVRDKVASPEALIDNAAKFKEKLDNGLYAVSYAFLVPDKATLEKAGKTYQYRKVYLNIKQDTDKFSYAMGTMDDGMGVVSLVKEKVAAEDIPQILKYYDFMTSDAGLKLASWGPKTAGLWEEKDGKRFFIDKELEACMVYNKENGKDIYYDLFRGINQAPKWVGGYSAMNSKWLPIYYYDKEVKPEDAFNNFSLGVVEPFQFVLGTGPNIWMFQGKVPEVDKFWAAKTAFEKALLTIQTAKSDTQFDQYFKDMVDLATKNGLDDKTLEKMDKLYKEEINTPFMQFMK